MQAILSGHGLVKSFGRMRAVDDVNLAVAPGEALGIVGPNGAGKTTLFGALAGAFPLSAGIIRLDGQNISAVPAPRRCALGIARTHQIPRPFLGMSVFENVQVAARAGGGLLPGDAIERAAQILATTELRDLANRPAGALGLLDRKRLELARALATNPRVLLLDEIGGGLTEGELEHLIALILNLKAQGLTIVWIEHILHALLKVIDRLVCMAEGRILAEGDPDSVMADPQVRAAYLGSDPE